VSLFECKLLAAIESRFDPRANYVRNDLNKRRAEELDSRHPGSIFFAQELAFCSKYFVLVSGPVLTFFVIQPPRVQNFGLRKSQGLRRVRNDLNKCAEELDSVTLVLFFLLKNSRLMVNTLFWSRGPVATLSCDFNPLEYKLLACD